MKILKKLYLFEADESWAPVLKRVLNRGKTRLLLLINMFQIRMMEMMCVMTIVFEEMPIDFPRSI
ncbi:hypothetical protein AGMMS49928_28040 [Spirochaetia bacterium]|nr:hypothetical protein AGMMS49928_28040 [Spirochaetia bacterium]